MFNPNDLPISLQVILFTRHSGVVEQAGELRTSVKICVHEL
ncbi:hypothetical protein NOC27_2427 [Nitrosococcus oceani AFC27]|nr:hypothetical protein NOC27_2427 [Nitrosococcus oceani AFC27]